MPLGLGIALFPLIFGWATFRPGYSRKAKALTLLSVALSIFMIGHYYFTISHSIHAKRTPVWEQSLFIVVALQIITGLICLNFREWKFLIFGSAPWVTATWKRRLIFTVLNPLTLLMFTLFMGLLALDPKTFGLGDLCLVLLATTIIGSLFVLIMRTVSKAIIRIRKSEPKVWLTYVISTVIFAGLLVAWAIPLKKSLDQTMNRAIAEQKAK